MRNRSPLVRIPERRGQGTRCELRLPDPSCNPYLALAVQLAAGPRRRHQGRGSARPGEQEHLHHEFSGNAASTGLTSCRETCTRPSTAWRRDEVIRDALGDHIYRRFVEGEAAGWQDYSAMVTPWEVDSYLGKY